VKLRFQIAHQTDIGRVRTHNEDSIAVWEPEPSSPLGPIAVVADGLGGHAAGEVASALAVSEVLGAYRSGEDVSPGELLRRGVNAAHTRILEHVAENPSLEGMGTTCTALAIAGSHAYVAHVGDSRAYLVSSAIRSLTVDHTVVQDLLASSRLDPKEAAYHPAAHVLTRALGMDEPLVVDLIRPVRIQDGDRFVLCSDGLTTHCAEAEIEAIVRAHDPTEACAKLVSLASERGGRDNISVVVVAVSTGPA